MSAHLPTALRRLPGRLALTGILVVSLAPMVGASPAPGPDNPWLQRRVLTLAHAGGEDENPQETLYAFGRAAAEGVSMLDMDVQIASDGVPIVMHDNKVDRTTDGSGAVYSMPFEAIHKLDAAYWYTADCAACHGRPAGDYLYRGIRNGTKPAPAGYTAEDFAVPSLEEVFQRFPSAYFDIEIKDDAGDVTELAQATAALIHKYGLASRVVIASFGGPGMTAFRAAAPDVATSATQDEVTAFVLGGTVPKDAQILDIPPTHDVAGSPFQVVTPERVDQAHDAGLAVWVWMDSKSQQNAEFYNKLLDMGVDGLNVSRPSVAMQVVRDRGDSWDPNAAPSPSPTTPPSTTTPGGGSGTTVPQSDSAPPATPRVANPNYTG